MDEVEIKAKLDTLAEYQAQKDAIALQKQELIDAVNAEKQKLLDEIYTPEIRAKAADIESKYSEQLKAVDVEFVGKGEAAETNISALEAEIKDAVKVAGVSVKATLLHAVWVKGRVSWDTKAMDGYAVDHPEILFMRKEGEPSVSIRKI